MASTNYYDITDEIDAREILRYLNDLGIRNITGEVLKHFITDLKKYILYDLNKKSVEGESKKLGPERLHSASTFCSRTRSKNQNGLSKCTRESQRSTEIVKDHCIKRLRPVYSAPNLNQNAVEHTRRACSCIPVIRKQDNTDIETKKSTISSNYNLIKVPLQKATHKKCDPVSLYHYYMSMWEKYKSNVPGENNWADLRWSVRQKMAGCVDKHNVKKVTKPKLESNKAQDR